MNAQQIFDTVINHLLAQGQACRDIYGTCCYRNFFGMACAVGCLISEAEYTSGMEGYRVSSDSYGMTLIDRWVEKNHPDHRGLLQDLQALHDGDAFGSIPDAWKQAIVTGAAKIAAKYNLTTGDWQ